MNLTSWLESLRTAETPPDGFTTRDICRALGIAERTARERLRAGMDRGTISHIGFRTETDVMGREHRVPVYQYVGGKNATKDNSVYPHHTDCAPKTYKARRPRRG